jgi:predicted nucleic-acid-binding protein
MIAFDIDILVRWLAQDDPVQSRHSSKWTLAGFSQVGTNRACVLD